METVQFKTNINCGGCIAKVKPFMAEEKNIKSWMVDVKDSEKVLTVQSEHLSPSEISQLISRAGFKAQPLEAKKSINIKFIPNSFWNDTPVWIHASGNTLNCLIGCTIGDFAMMMYLQTYYHGINIFLMMTLAMIAGISTSIILETCILKINQGFAWAKALNTAIGMSMLSMITMELAENITDLMLTGGGSMPISNPIYWLALIPSVMAGFLVPLPYNYYKLKKHGKACH